MKKYVLGMDIGGTNTRLGLIDEAYELTDFVIEKSEHLQGQGDTLKNLTDIIKRYLKEYASDKEVAAVCAGFPSTIDKDRKTVLSTPNIRGLDNINVVDKMGSLLGLPVYIETDVDMLVLYDIFKNGLPDRGVVCGFYFGTGIGNAVVINGNLLIGKTGAAAELGHIPVRGITGTCGCGNANCIELIASGYRLRQLCSEKFPDTDIGEVFVKHSETAEIKLFVDDLALAVATEINILDPDYIILGGGLTKMRQFPFEELKKAVYKYARKPYPAKELSYIYSEQGQENGVIGAGILGFKKIKEAAR